MLAGFQVAFYCSLELAFIKLSILNHCARAFHELLHLALATAFEKPGKLRFRKSHSHPGYLPPPFLLGRRGDPLALSLEARSSGSQAGSGRRSKVDPGGTLLGSGSRRVNRPGGAQKPAGARVSASVGARKHPRLWEPRGKPREPYWSFFRNRPQFPRSQTKMPDG